MRQRSLITEVKSKKVVRAADLALLCLYVYIGVICARVCVLVSLCVMCVHIYVCIGASKNRPACVRPYNIRTSERAVPRRARAGVCGAHHQTASCRLVIGRQHEPAELALPQLSEIIFYGLLIVCEPN